VGHGPTDVVLKRFNADPGATELLGDSAGRVASAERVEDEVILVCQHADEELG